MPSYHFTRKLAPDLAGDNIHANPGIIRTRFHEKMTTDQPRYDLANRIQLHREGTSEDVAEVVRSLTTNQLKTGESVAIDGGMGMQTVC
ncbi:SDR family oxidoreductase [Adhaeretor mobilis]|uniref:3-ketoacyl-(Acyl-carrier-protein) reductase n=1 Tax=Adhaeretor mobilis TaxID=1930276 RepID=A0A517MYJ9_9BACT|nr:SDR family oxidoreductase [Adhaeretor mobilis]QDS99955.1 3-ketoacyl-(acyl-carrier-protein) reductase [Adhaeretor mobilis]